LEGCHGLAHVASPVDLTGNADEAEMVRMAVAGTERAMRFAASAGTVRRVVVTATMASVCGTQRDKNPDHLWSEADKNDNPGTPYSKSKTAAEAKVCDHGSRSACLSTASVLILTDDSRALWMLQVWELAAEFDHLYGVTTVHPAVVLGTLLPAQPVTSTMGLLKQVFDGKVMPSMFGVCDAVDVAKVHVAGLTRHETAGQRYLVCSKDQWSTLELAEMAAAAGASGVDLSAWRADAKIQAMKPKKPATDNRKACELLGVDDLVAPAKSVAASWVSMLAQGHVK
jgi:dihydroflavonol-4-reductase